MDATTVRIVAGVVFIVLLVIIVARRKRMGSKRKPIP